MKTSIIHVKKGKETEEDGRDVVLKHLYPNGFMMRITNDLNCELLLRFANSNIL